MIHIPKLYDLKGKQFNYLKVIEKHREPIGKQIYWNCECCCGKTIIVNTRDLTHEKIKSCGCMKRYIQSEKKKTHGMSNTRIFGIWSGMKNRCYIPSSSNYEIYGGRGITVCQEWLYDFMSFYNWAMENGYSDGLTIDRIDPNGNYCPENCRWATIKEQSNNRRNNRFLTAFGETHTVSEWSDISGIGRRVIETRIDDLHWNTEKALTVPVRKTRLSSGN